MSSRHSNNAPTRPVELEEIWRDLNNGIQQIYKREYSLTCPQYMDLYT